MLCERWSWWTHKGAQVDPSGRFILYTWMEKGMAKATRILDLETGIEREYHRLMHHPRWSPDGKWIVGVDASGAPSGGSGGEIAVCPLDSGPCTPLPAGHLPVFSYDGNRVYFARNSGKTDLDEIWSVAVDGTDAKEIGNLEISDEFFDVSRIGEIIYVEFEEGRQELWLADLSG